MFIEVKICFTCFEIMGSEPENHTCQQVEEKDNA